LLTRALVDLAAIRHQPNLGVSKTQARNIRRAEKRRLRVEETRALEGFYLPWSTRIRELGSPALPRAYFEQLVRAFGDDVVLFSVRHDSTPIGGAFLVRRDDTAFLLNTGCPVSWLKQFAGWLLFDHVLRWAIDQGLRYGDLGRSQPGGGTEHFKRQFGAASLPLYSYGLDRLAIDGPVGRAATSLWKWLPTPVANAIGPAIRYYIPFG
jgi:predicted N-acyltransferase